MIGRRILHYEVLERLGQGGMGVVYKARDTHLDRFVAIKTLPEDKVGDSERRRRFVREAKAASALQHAGIVTIHDIVRSDGFDCIVMEHVEGRTLDALIPSGGMRLGQALKIATQIADALAAAHEKGIVHRDLKPTNVMVRPDGTVKILDFGLAKLAEPAPVTPDAETRSMTAVTEEGTVLGTAAYMSPEQAEGRAVDARTDIFSLGAVLYEMVAGRQAFQGDSRIQTLTAVLHREPKPLADVPGDLAKIIMRCLRKDPDRRFQSMKDVKLELEDLKQETDPAGVGVPAVPQKPARRRRWALGAGLAALGAVGWGVFWYARSHEPAVLNLQIARFTFDAGLTTAPALSADGKLAAYASDRSGEGNLDIYVQHTSGVQSNRLTRHEADDYDPSLSPDGSKVAFRSDREGGGIYVIDAMGGTERKLVALGMAPKYSPDGSMIAYFTWPLSGMVEDSGLFVVPSEGGQPKQICPEFGVENSFTGTAALYWSPDGSRILFRGAKKRAPALLNWYVAPLAGGEPVAAGIPPAPSLVYEMTHPVGWFGDHVYFTRGTLVEGMNVFRIPIQRDTLRLEGRVQQLTSGGSATRQISFASDGRTLFSSFTPGVEFWAYPLQPGKPEVTGTPFKATSDATIKGHASVSEDGKTLAYIAYVSWQLPRSEIRVRNLDSGNESAFVSKTLPPDSNPQISPDGSTIAYADRINGRVSVFAGPAGNLPGRLVCESGRPVGFMPDSRQLLVAEDDKRIVRVDIASGAKTPLLDAGSMKLCYVQFGYVLSVSPDSRWMAFSLDAPGGGHPTFVAPLKESATPREEWIRLEGSGDSSWSPVFSPGGGMLYMMSNRDGHGCIWGQRLDPITKRPVGSQFAVRHIHRPETSEAIWGRQMFLLPSRDKLIVNIASRTGNLWMTRVNAR